MSTCRACGRPLDRSDRFCPSCGAALHQTQEPTALVDDNAVTVDSPASSPPQRRGSGSERPRSGWLSSSGSVDHGRFEPGALLGDRYRIVGRLGGGGMGEVYRADDLKLGQPVALKFLPEELERDSARLAQLHNEVRLARQIAHKNVCRVYDVGEADGLPFLTMEYVDGEDLAALLRRIGRLPEDKALEIARQLCAGLAAAHERHVLHRDLKPANVMIDGQGQVRITDFGLAAVAGTADMVRAGTPGYMAPEQLAGKDATSQSDIFALGLILYEVFTGRRAFSASTVPELVRQQQSPLTPPTEVVRDLDPSIERVILRCLAPDPHDRPRSALAVAAALPGGDPLAAALAAGETPSPEAVAAAGEREAMVTWRVGALVGLAVAVSFGAAVWAATRQVTALTPMPRSPEVLADRAMSALEALGYEGAAHSSWGFFPDQDYIRYLERHPEYVRAADPYATRPGALYFYFRTSPRPLIPINPLGAVTMNDPPLTQTDMTLVVLDPEGRLKSLLVITPQREEDPAPARPVDWSVLFDLAGLDSKRFTQSEPRWLPRGYADTRAAWTGTFAERPGTEIRVEAAAWHGKAVFFDVVGPWTEPTRLEYQAPASTGARLVNAFAAAAFVVLLAVAVYMARSHINSGRGDRRAATRIAAIALLGQMITWVFNDPHPLDPQVEVDRLFTSLGEALFAAVLLYVLYLALEPIMRRHWPDSLLGWSRLVQGRILDPRVGRDVLIGIAAGGTIQLLITAQAPLQALAGQQVLGASLGNLRFLEGPSYAIGLGSSLLSFQATFNAMWVVVAIVGLKRVLKRMWLVGIVATAFLAVVAANGLFIDQPGLLVLNIAIAVIVVVVLVTVVIRFGLLATVATFLTTYTLSNTPWSLNTGRWDFPAIAVSAGLLLALIVFGGWAARAHARS